MTHHNLAVRRWPDRPNGPGTRKAIVPRRGAVGAGERRSWRAPLPDATGAAQAATLVPRSLSAQDAWGLFSFDRMLCRRQTAALRSEWRLPPAESPRPDHVLLRRRRGEQGRRCLRPRPRPVRREHEPAGARDQTMPRADYAAVRAANPKIEIGRRVLLLTGELGRNVSRP